MEQEVFEKYYTRVRAKESRIYTDEQVCSLPEIAPGHPCAQEWKIRKRSAEKLVEALEAAHRPLSVLEIGCGNGWLAHRLSRIPGTRVTGLDINGGELNQARRVFGQQQHLQFLFGDIRSGLLQGQLFDRIIFAAAIQYFPSLSGILDVCLQHLEEEGEIHLLDSFFYAEKELAGARQRTASYYQEMGVPEMTAYYFHQSLEDLAHYPYQVMNPPRWQEWFITGRGKDFPWIRIQKSKVGP